MPSEGEMLIEVSARALGISTEMLTNDSQNMANRIARRFAQDATGEVRSVPFALRSSLTWI